MGHGTGGNDSDTVGKRRRNYEDTRYMNAYLSVFTPIQHMPQAALPHYSANHYQLTCAGASEQNNDLPHHLNTTLLELQHPDTRKQRQLSSHELPLDTPA